MNLFEPDGDPEIGWKPFLKRAALVVAFWAVLGLAFYLVRLGEGL